MKNLIIGRETYQVLQDGAMFGVAHRAEDGKIKSNYGSDFTWFFNNPQNDDKMTFELLSEPLELENTPKYVKALEAHGLTESEEIAALKEFYNINNGKTYKKQAASIYKEATWTAMYYDTPHPPHHYWNSWLDDLRGINNDPQTAQP